MDGRFEPSCLRIEVIKCHIFELPAFLKEVSQIACKACKIAADIEKCWSIHKRKPRA